MGNPLLRSSNLSESTNEMNLGGGMSPTFDYHSGVKPLDFQARGRVPTIHGYPYLSKLRWEFTSIV
jgi:hypothetical protein